MAPGAVWHAVWPTEYVIDALRTVLHIGGQTPAGSDHWARLDPSVLRLN